MAIGLELTGSIHEAVAALEAKGVKFRRAGGWEIGIVYRIPRSRWESALSGAVELGSREAGQGEYQRG
jgi:hypothetical protein